MATASDIPPVNSRVTTRLFFQDDEAKTIRWADVVAEKSKGSGLINALNDSLAGQKINEAEGFRWDYRDVIAFSCVFRQRDHEKPVIPCPLRYFCPLPLRRH
jgi:hypothetical protein